MILIGVFCLTMYDDVIIPAAEYLQADLRIAKAEDGRNILFAVNVNIKNGAAVDKDFTQKRQKPLAAEVLSATPIGTGVSQDADDVKGEMQFSSRDNLREKHSQTGKGRFPLTLRTPIFVIKLQEHFDKSPEEIYNDCRI